MSSRFDPTRPVAGRAFFKGHGLGNDYLVFDEGGDVRLSPEAVAAVCHRWEGPGGDGIVVLLGSDGPPFRLRMFNPDGSEFERSGNGLRVLAAYLYRAGRVADEPFEAEVGGDRVRMRVHGVESGLYDISVDMGRARIGADAVGLAPGQLGDAGELSLEGVSPLRAVTVAVGNPHCVVFGDPDPFERLSLEALEDIGSALTDHGAFPEGVNVQLARVRPPGLVEALVWERGVGHTSASGTSACAVAVAAVSSGRTPPGDLEIHMEGGTLAVSVSPGLDVVLRGPVRAVYDGVLDPGCP